MRYFPESVAFLIVMTATDEFRPTRDIRPYSFSYSCSFSYSPLYLDEYAHAMREQELFLDLTGCLDANV